jgi:GxxExxY protein
MDLKEEANQLSKQIIGAAIEVHKALGPGLLESAYEACLSHELTLRQVSFKRQVPLPLFYKGLDLECSYRLDLLVNDLVVVEIKSVESLLPIHEAQIITYLRLSRHWLGLLINFNVPVLKSGIKPIVSG